MRRIVVPATLLAVAVAGCGGGGSPHFRPSSGWHVGSHGIYSWASTIPYRDCENCVPPHQTLETLPPNGVVIQLSTLRERVSSSVDDWPPRIRSRDVKAGFEGVPYRYGVFQVSVRNRRAERAVYVWFGRAHPSPAQIRAANAELARLRA